MNQPRAKVLDGDCRRTAINFATQFGRASVPQFGTDQILLRVCSFVALVACSARPQGEVALENNGAEYALIQIIPETTRSKPLEVVPESIWMYNRQMTRIGADRYRVWLDFHRHFYSPIAPWSTLVAVTHRRALEVDCRDRTFREASPSGEIPERNAVWTPTLNPGLFRDRIDSICGRLPLSH